MPGGSNGGGKDTSNPVQQDLVVPSTPSTGLSSAVVREITSSYYLSNGKGEQIVNPVWRIGSGGRDMDYEEYFGTLAYQALSDLADTYVHCKTNEERAIVLELADEVRRIAKKRGADNLEWKETFLQDLGISYSLCAVEKMIVMGNRGYGASALAAGQEALKATIAKYGGDGWDIGDEADAYRHAYWSYLLTSYTEVNFATNFLNAHEFGNHENFHDVVHKLGNGKTSYELTRMDLNNNYAGIGAAVQAQNDRIMGLPFPYGVPAAADEYVTGLISGGQLSIYFK